MNPLRLRAASVLLLLLSSCSSNSSTPAGPTGPQDITNVIYVAPVTDEALKRLLDSTPKDDPRKALRLDSPDLGAPLPQASAATFTFTLASGAMRAPGLRLGPAQNQPSQWRRAFHELVQFVSPERIAHAHGAPYNGDAYYLVFSGADSKPILQVFTPELTFTPEDTDWQHLVQAPQPLTLEITSAFFEENDVPVDGGPYVGGKFSFKIE